MIGLAHDLGLLTTPHVFSAAHASAMTDVGADVVVCHMGLATGATIGAETALTLDDCVRQAIEWAEAARAVRENVFVRVHGGPIAEPDDAAYVLDRANAIRGYYQQPHPSSAHAHPTRVGHTAQPGASTQLGEDARAARGNSVRGHSPVTRTGSS